MWVIYNCQQRKGALNGPRQELPQELWTARCFFKLSKTHTGGISQSSGLVERSLVLHPFTPASSLMRGSTSSSSLTPALKLRLRSAPLQLHPNKKHRLLLSAQSIKHTKPQGDVVSPRAGWGRVELLVAVDKRSALWCKLWARCWVLDQQPEPA